MSYCRFSEGDVYAYSTDGGVQFWVAGGFDKSLDHLCNTYNDAYEYAKSLRDAHGLTVPRHAIEMLRSDAIEEAKRFAGSGAFEDLEAELREEVEDQQGYDQMLRDRLRQQTELYVKAKGENERLRELVLAFDWCTENFDAPCKCERCPLPQSDSLVPECEVRMREMGIEAGQDG